jgi:uncharacterized protein (DUF1800 family)
MADEDALLTAAQARHLLRRTGFGAPPRQVAKIVGRTRDQVMAFEWVDYMLRTRVPLQEKLVLFWHDHFATDDTKVMVPQAMARQNALFRRFCKGNFKELVKAVNRDLAMIIFLDTALNQKELPNENYARELQELFTLGVTDLASRPNYAQEDVAQIARAFTGWRYTPFGEVVFDPLSHDYMADYPERGPKVIYRGAGGFSVAGGDFTSRGEGRPEIDTVVDIIFEHTDSDGQNTVARFIAGKLFTYFAQPGLKRRLAPALAPIVDQLIEASRFAVTWDMAALLRALFVSDAFYATGAPAPLDLTAQKSMRWPIDYIVSTLRLLKVRPKGFYRVVDGGDRRSLELHLRDMGQVLFRPPSVFGWDWETAWVSSATLLARYKFARDVTAAHRTAATGFRPQRLIRLDLTDPVAIVEAVLDVLGVADQFTDSGKGVLIDYLTDNGARPVVNLRNYATRHAKLYGLFALVLQSPAYQMQ